jgi:transitional endoplasmic reticulum ATPase
MATKIGLEVLRDMENKFDSKACSRFIVHGNINDYLPHSSNFIDLKYYLSKWLKEKLDVIVFFDIAAGLHFPFPDQEKRFREHIGHTKRKPKITDEQKRNMDSAELRELAKALEELESAPEPPFPDDPIKILKMFREIISTSGNGKGPIRIGLVVNYAETIVPNNKGGSSPGDRIAEVALKNLVLDEKISSEGHAVILLTKNISDIQEGLRGRGSSFQSVEIPLPKKDERLAFVNNYIARNGTKLDMSNEDFAHNTGGLTLREMEYISKQSKIVTFEIISREKSKYFADEFEEVLKIMEPRFGLSKGLGGLENIKDYMLEIKKGLLKGDHRLVPPAILLMGPPGTGKSAIAEAIAWEWGVPFVEILNVRTMWHGESEKMALKIKSALESLYPCVLWCDEFDQEEAPRGSYQGDSGTSSRLRKIRFQMTSDPNNRGKLLFMYATNRPDLIDAADKRSGRASTRIPMILPDNNEREKIYQIMATREGFESAVTDYKPIVKASLDAHGDFISGADIMEISLGAFRRSAVEGHRKVAMDDYLYAVSDFVAQEQNETLIRSQEEMAVRERSSNRFLSNRGFEILERLNGKKVAYTR